jgi:hypothetical protein
MEMNHDVPSIRRYLRGLSAQAIMRKMLCDIGD